MAMTQFAMVDELASLIKDNLVCKHLVLSTEEIFVDFLQSDSSPDGVLELKPMSAYHRLLLHRLADIFGFDHESVGEGDHRHLVLGRCPESTIPSILVSDILCHYDGYQPLASSQLVLRSEEASDSRLVQTLPPSTSFKAKEAAYLAARERIFSLHKSDEKEITAPKCRGTPVVARRMIAHALGQKICSSSSSQNFFPQSFCAKNSAGSVNNEENVDQPNLISKATKDTSDLPMDAFGIRERKNERLAGKSSGPCAVFGAERNVQDKVTGIGSSKSSSSRNVCNEREVDIEHMERERIGAAKRIFAHALGLPFAKGNQSPPFKPSATETENRN